MQHWHLGTKMLDKNQMHVKTMPEME